MKFKKIVFNNDSSVETIEDSSTKRSNRYEEQLRKQMQYWRQHPEEFIEYIWNKFTLVSGTVY